jgi:molybdate transport system regulatory protein
LARLVIRIEFDDVHAVGPGKIRLLEAIRDAGSIREAGRSLGMSYRRAWLLVADMNACFEEPVVSTQLGGVHGGGAAVTRFGAQLIESYREIERKAHGASSRRLAKLDAARAKSPSASRKRS